MTVNYLKVEKVFDLLLILFEIEIGNNIKVDRNKFSKQSLLIGVFVKNTLYFANQIQISSWCDVK